MPVFPQIDASVQYNDFRDDLARDGYAVVKNVITKEKAAYYVDCFLGFCEMFPLGFDRNDPSTWTQDHFPIVAKGGLFAHSVAHEAWNWEARQEPGVLDVFAKCWNTEELITAFDGGNLALPGPMQAFNAERWDHTDQHPLKHGIRSIQGILNLNPNGPNDGGLILLPGSHKLFDGYFDEKWAEQADPEWLPGGQREKQDFYPFKRHEAAWFENQGLQWKKVCADPGDLIIWDSRTLHYNTPMRSQQVRCVLYLCYEPAAAGDAENYRKKRESWEARETTTHWPISQVRVKDEPILRNGVPCPYKRTKPFVEPVITPKLLKLAGVEPY